MHETGHSIRVRIAFVGGGSLNWAMSLMSDLAFDTRLAADVRLYDINYAAAERNAEVGQKYAAVSKGTPAVYSAKRSLADALEGADVVVISILPGRFEDMAQDIGVPAAHGIPQAVGDTVGPGGIVRAIRAIPMFAEIALAIREHAPAAYVCNLTNPMSVLTGTLHRVFPGIRAWGECHEVTKIRRQVAWIANKEAGEDVYSNHDVEVNVLGINHFTFVDRIALAGRDMMPAYRDFVKAQSETGWSQTEPGKDAEHAQYFGSRNLVSFDLFRRFGIPAAAGDRHLAEFFLLGDYLVDPKRWGFGLTPVDYRIRDREVKRARAEALRTGEATPVARRSDEEMVDQIAALMSGVPFVSNVNLPNQGQLARFPLGTIVETNALFSGLGITPLHAGRLPEPLERHVLAHAKRQTALVDAVLSGTRAAIYPIFRDDPLVVHLAERDADSLLDRMLDATASWLPDNLKGEA